MTKESESRRMHKGKAFVCDSFCLKSVFSSSGDKLETGVAIIDRAVNEKFTSYWKKASSKYNLEILPK